MWKDDEGWIRSVIQDRWFSKRSTSSWGRGRVEGRHVFRRYNYVAEARLWEGKKKKKKS